MKLLKINDTTYNLNAMSRWRVEVVNVGEIIYSYIRCAFFIDQRVSTSNGFYETIISNKDMTSLPLETLHGIQRKIDKIIDTFCASEKSHLLSITSKVDGSKWFIELTLMDNELNSTVLIEGEG
jgi:hypothetical protein